MTEQGSFTSFDVLPLDDLRKLLGTIDHIHHPRGIRIMRRYLMRCEENKFDSTTLSALRTKILIPSPITLSSCIPKESYLASYKFVREKDRLIMFPESEDENKANIMHIHYAIADGMYLPDDAGFMNFYKSGRFQVEGSSSSLHVSPFNNLDRPATISLLTGITPPEISLST